MFYYRVTHKYMLFDHIEKKDIPAIIKKLHKEMDGAVKNLNFEHAIELREKIRELEAILK